MSVPSKYESALEGQIQALKTRLGQNLYSLVLYGSTVRDAIVADVSDINLLIVLERSTPEAHEVIADCIRGKVPVDPFIVGREGMARTLEVFALKFRSIRRHYRLLHGADPLAEMQVDEALLRTLCEQQLRNLLLRSAHFYAVHGRDPKRYTGFLRRTEPIVFTVLSELLRLTGTEVPDDFSERPPLLSKVLELDTSVLDDLRRLHDRPRKLAASEVWGLHARLHQLLDGSVSWLERRWPRSSG